MARNKLIDRHNVVKVVESLDNGIVFFTESGLRLVLTLDNIL